MSEYHVPVMFEECMNALEVKKGGIYLDGTLGGGGHSEGILLRGGMLVAIDRDQDALAESEKRFRDKSLSGYTLVKSNFHDAAKSTRQSEYRLYRRSSSGPGHLVASDRRSAARIFLSFRRKAGYANG